MQAGTALGKRFTQETPQRGERSDLSSNWPKEPARTESILGNLWQMNIPQRLATVSAYRERMVNAMKIDLPLKALGLFHQEGGRRFSHPRAWQKQPYRSKK
jgi:hypothetical protein